MYWICKKCLNHWSTVHPLAVNLQLICNHSNSEVVMSMQLLADKLDIFLSPACGRPTATRVIFHILPSLNLLCD